MSWFAVVCPTPTSRFKSALADQPESFPWLYPYRLLRALGNGYNCKLRVWLAFRTWLGGLDARSQSSRGSSAATRLSVFVPKLEPELFEQQETLALSTTRQVARYDSIVPVLSAC